MPKDAGIPKSWRREDGDKRTDSKRRKEFVFFLAVAAAASLALATLSLLMDASRDMSSYDVVAYTLRSDDVREDVLDHGLTQDDCKRALAMVVSGEALVVRCVERPEAR